MEAKILSGRPSEWFDILDYHLDEKTGMITLLFPDETIIVHKTNVIISVKMEVK